MPSAANPVPARPTALVPGRTVPPLASLAARASPASPVGHRLVCHLGLLLGSAGWSGSALAAPPPPAPEVTSAARFSITLPLYDGADPLPRPLDLRPGAVGGSRVDLRGAVAVALDRPVELIAELRYAPYGLLLANDAVVFGQRLTAELGATYFTPANLERSATGLWSGGFVDLRLSGELFGRRRAGELPLVPATAHAALGYRKELSAGTAAWLALGGGLILDPQQWTVGGLVQAGILSERALRRRGSRAQ